MAMGLNDISALEAINNLSELRFKINVKFLGDERRHQKLPKNIVKFRSEKKITSTSDLVKIIEKVRKNIQIKLIHVLKLFKHYECLLIKKLPSWCSEIINASKKA